MKIVFLVPRFSGGGAEFVARQWSEYLQSRGDHVLALVTSPRVGEPTPENVAVHTVSAKGFLRSAFEIRRFVKSERPDALVALMPYWNLLAVFSTRLLGSKPRVIISGRNMATQLRGSFGLAYRVKQFLARISYRWADEFLAISHPVAAEAIALYGLRPEKVSVIFNPSLNSTREGGQTCFDASKPLSILVPARIVRQKRPHLAVDVAVACRELSNEEVELHYFGVGPLAESVSKYASEQGVSAAFHGWRDDWTDNLPANSVVLLPSVSEGFGNVLVEAARAGVPAVASSRALGVADAIVPGITGILVADDTAHEFASGLLEAARIRDFEIQGWLSTFTKEASGTALRRRLQVITGVT